MRELLLTLGHNSSAILIEDGVVQWGYETERVTGVKSDSRFPLHFLEQWGANVGKIDVAHVTHWAPDGQLSNMTTKYWDPLPYLEGVSIHTLDPANGRSHHDTHMYAALAYANSGDKPFPLERSYGVVVDGFGNLGEHFSVYDLSSGQPQLVRRIHGYDTSLGLWYQYATAFMGLKMHEDEYKLLGYQVHLTEEEYAVVTNLAYDEADAWYGRMQKSVYGSKFDPLYDVKALDNYRKSVADRLTKVCDFLQLKDLHSVQSRAVLSHYVQTVLERVVTYVIDEFNPRNLVLSGGCFYNVKLNKTLIDFVDGVVCAYPLAGDQGNALGLYSMTYRAAGVQWKFPKDLFWGRRVLRDAGNVPNMFCGDTNMVYSFVADRLRNVGYVNLVRGSMEFGPRALCNTSTLAVPTRENVDRINYMNERNTVMPMAPVMTRHMYNKLFEKTGNVWLSEAHMIVALEHAEAPWPWYEGVCHKYSRPYNHHTSRPQVIDAHDHFMNALLDEFGGVLINTSFNYHGRPIALGMDSVVSNHMAEYSRDQSISTAVITHE